MVKKLFIIPILVVCLFTIFLLDCHVIINIQTGSLQITNLALCKLIWLVWFFLCLLSNPQNIWALPWSHICILLIYFTLFLFPWTSNGEFPLLSSFLDHKITCCYYSYSSTQLFDVYCFLFLDVITFFDAIFRWCSFVTVIF